MKDSKSDEDHQYHQCYSPLNPNESVKYWLKGPEREKQYQKRQSHSTLSPNWSMSCWQKASERNERSPNWGHDLRYEPSTENLIDNTYKIIFVTCLASDNKITKQIGATSNQFILIHSFFCRKRQNKSKTFRLLDQKIVNTVFVILAWSKKP